MNRGDVFSIARLPRIEFGHGVFSLVPAICHRYGQRVLLVTGAESFKSSVFWEQLLEGFSQQGMEYLHASVAGEPSPQWVDETVRQFVDQPVDVVLAIGGGSALDAGKAVAGLLRTGNSVMEHLEGVGPELPYQGPAIPLVAVPTTAGTGSEATKNAVLSIQGSDGFKKSFRDEQLVAEYAVVDPQLLASCPAAVIAANGMDALTQLIESYVSLNANLLTDALGTDAMRAVRTGLLRLYQSEGSDIQAREQMAWGSLVSGINLAQTGLGSVHGLASPLGAFFPIPHGVVCGTLVAEATRVNIEAMKAREPDNPALGRYARIAELLHGKHFFEVDAAHNALLELLEQWTEKLALPPLANYGVQEKDFTRVIENARGSSMKTNPIVLTDDELHVILTKRL